jgi:predicted DNA-binding transcriptional regulator AlpA
MLPVVTTRQRKQARPERVFTLREVAKLTTLSLATLRRTIKAGDGPRVIRLSPRRLGVRESDFAVWQQASICPTTGGVR